MIQVYIGVLAYSKLHRSDSIIHRALVFVFCLSFTCTLLYTILLGTVIVLHMSNGLNAAIQIGYSISFFFYIAFGVILLLNLVIRLYLTFKQSALAMSNHTVSLFVVVFTTLLISGMLFVVGFTLFNCGQEFGWIFYLSTLFPHFLLYATGCALAVRLFVRNLSSVAKMQLSSPCSVNPEDISLNHQQQKLLYLSAKYILLFFVTILSSALTVVLTLIVSSKCSGLFMSVDCCVNLLCLHLQFAFATKHYQKCCGIFDSQCRSLVVKRAKRDLHREILSSQRENEMQSLKYLDK